MSVTISPKAVEVITAFFEAYREHAEVTGTGNTNAAGNCFLLEARRQASARAKVP